MVSPYFNNHQRVSEQSLVEDLIIEAIHIFGYDVMYIPREGNTPDTIFKEDSSAEYNSSYPVEMYIKSFDGFTGDGQFLSRFGIEIRHELTLTVAIKTFKVEVGNQIGTKRPLEGDLIYYPMDNKLFVIKNVNKYGVFYQTGTLQTYDLICEVFEYAGEKLATGIPEVDIIEDELSLSTKQRALRDGQGNLVLDSKGKPQFDPSFNEDTIMKDFMSDSEEVETEADGLTDFTENNPFSEDF